MRLTDEQIANITTTDYYDFCEGVEPDSKGEDLIHIEPEVFFDEFLDKKRKENGYLPLFDDSGDYDSEGWYEQRIRVNVNTKKAESFVAWTENTNDDDEIIYEEPFDEEIQEKIYNRIVEYLGENVFYSYKEGI